ncbi:hypothetical protein, partial [Shewanella algae]|uniref:hypothetical protein n=1 Tax=Shewanella algae TaxID=38313 RepID=UPI0031F52644
HENGSLCRFCLAIKLYHLLPFCFQFPLIRDEPKKRPAIAGLYVHYRSYSLGVVMLFFLLFLMVEIQTAASDDSEKNEQPQHA